MTPSHQQATLWCGDCSHSHNYCSPYNLIHCRVSVTIYSTLFWRQNELYIDILVGQNIGRGAAGEKLPVSCANGTLVIR